MKTAGQRKMVDSVLHKPLFIQDLSSHRFGDQTKTNSAHVHSVWLVLPAIIMAVENQTVRHDASLYVPGGGR